MKESSDEYTGKQIKLYNFIHEMIRENFHMHHT